MGRKVLEAAVGAGAQPREEAEAAVAVHGGWRVLKSLDVLVSRAAVKVALEEGDARPWRSVSGRSGESPLPCEVLAGRGGADSNGGSEGEG